MNQLRTKHMPPAEAARELAEIGDAWIALVRRLDDACMRLPRGIVAKIEAIPYLERLDAAQGKMLKAIADDIEVEA